MRLKKTDASNPMHWFELAADRLRMADTGWDEEGITPGGVEMLQQAVERYLKGFLIAKGWTLEKTHDLELLIRAAAERDNRFAAFIPFGIILTEDFFAQHYPGGDLTSLHRNYREMRAQVDKILELIRSACAHQFPS
jgi:HEPN domain-containing protein